MLNLQPSKTLFALMDCNNFYASCERVFNPTLAKRPIIVLSNNDGCVVARSNEAKSLGIGMGTPYYKNRKLIERHNIHVFSSNYPLYADMSNRVMTSLNMQLPNTEVYSIDEAFIRLDPSSPKLLPFIKRVQANIQQWTGIPVSFGIAPTKTLSKIANRVAKQRKQPIFDMRPTSVQQHIMQNMPLKSLWGISARLSKKLHNLHIYTALDLALSDAKLVRQHCGLPIEQMIYELRGIACKPIETQEHKKSILSSKSFGEPITDLAHIQAAMANYAARVSEKLRLQSCKAHGISVFLHTNPFSYRDSQYHNSSTIHLSQPTSDTGNIIQCANEQLKALYKPNYHYHKCGIMLFDLLHNSAPQQNFMFSETAAHPQHQKRERLMEALDAINQSMGRNTLYYATQNLHNAWQSKCNNRSNRYTTRWDELVCASIA